MYGQRGDMDEQAIIELAAAHGGHKDGSGTCLISMERDLSFSFRSQSGADEFSELAEVLDGVDRVEL